MRLLCRVTQEEIDKNRHCSDACPVTEAILAHFKPMELDADGWRVNGVQICSRATYINFAAWQGQTLFNRHYQDYGHVKPPRSVSRFILQYDREVKPTKPFSFYITIPDALKVFLKEKSK